MVEEKKDEDALKKPTVPYSTDRGRRIIFFHSFEEMEEEMNRYRARLTPEERLTAVTNGALCWWAL